MKRLGRNTVAISQSSTYNFYVIKRSVRNIYHDETPWRINMNIRYGIIDDAKMLSELGAKTFYDSFARDNTPENIAIYLKKSFSIDIQKTELSNPEIVFLIAEMEGIPIGYVKLNLNHDHDSQIDPKAMELERIYAEQEYIGKGVGKELMQACRNEAKQRGCDRIWLGVWEKNPRAIGFYKKWGFKEVGTHLFMLGNDPQKDFILELEL